MRKFLLPIFGVYVRFPARSITNTSVWFPVPETFYQSRYLLHHFEKWNYKHILDQVWKTTHQNVTSSSGSLHPFLLKISLQAGSSLQSFSPFDWDLTVTTYMLTTYIVNKIGCSWINGYDWLLYLVFNNCNSHSFNRHWLSHLLRFLLFFSINLSMLSIVILFLLSMSIIYVRGADLGERTMWSFFKPSSGVGLTF